MPRQLPPLQTLLAFEAAARLGSQSAAARELGLTQPAVSQRLQQLEASLGQVLFERSPRGLVLTPAGRLYLQAAQGAFDQLEQAGEALRRRADRRTVRIAVNFGFAQLWLMPRIGALRGAFPRAVFRLLTSDQDEGDCDLAVRYGTGRWPGWTAELMFGEDVFPVCAPGYLDVRPHLRPGGVTPGDLARESLLHMDEASDRWLTWSNWAKALDVRLPDGVPPVLYSNYPLLLQAALAGDGVALGWGGLVDGLLASGALVRLMPGLRRPGRGYYLARRHGLGEPRALLRQVGAWLLDEARSS